MKISDVAEMMESIASNEYQDLSFDAVQATSYQQASYAYETIMKRIKDFQDSLDDNHEVGVMLASFGQSITMTVYNIGYTNPNTLIFYGFVNGKDATLIQHMTQLNFLLLAMEKNDPAKPPRRIGFDFPNRD